MTEPYLILHKVRGEPVFDVAYILSEEGTDSDPGPWWVTNFGHRAYPVLDWSLHNLNGVHLKAEVGPIELHPSWDALPDHIQHSIDQTASKSKTPIQSLDVANALANLIKPQAPLVRRKI